MEAPLGLLRGLFSSIPLSLVHNAVKLCFSQYVFKAQPAPSKFWKWQSGFYVSSKYLM